jgi:hypothetical protein
MTEKTLTARISALETQLAVLKAQAHRLGTPAASHALADHYGMLAGKVDSSAEEIDAMHYRFEWEGHRAS